MSYSLERSAILRVGPRGALLFRASDGLRLRLNAAGGTFLAALHGNTLEAGWELFRSATPGAPKSPDPPSVRVLLDALRLGALRHGAEGGGRVFRYPGIEPPEVVHLAVTGRCNYDCPSCYARRSESGLLGPDELGRLAEGLAGLGVLELSIGGGEPLLRDDLEDVVGRASKRMVVNVTTNGSLVDEGRARRLKGAGVNLVQVSVNGPDERTNALSRQAGTWKEAARAVGVLAGAGVPTGLNVLVTRALLGRLDETVALFAPLGLRQVIFVRPKPRFSGDAWFRENAPGREDMGRLASEVRGLPRLFPGLALTVDSTFGPLFQDIPADRLRAQGFRGLGAGRSSVFIDSDGSVYPGSHFVEPRFRAGNVRDAPFRDIWERAEPMRLFRELPGRLEGSCAACDLRPVCLGGCRRTAWTNERNLNAEDSFCVRSAAH